jgi:Ion channel
MVTNFISLRNKKFLVKYKYELLLMALLQHLFIGIVLPDLDFYTHFIWPLNMLILGLASLGVFIEKGRWKNLTQNTLFITVLALPISLPVFGHHSFFLPMLSIIYVLFFAFIFFEVMQFLIRPGYINLDIISASACGYFLLIEIAVFLMQTIFYLSDNSFLNINTSSSASVYIDLVYFCSIIITSIGLGDILPNSHYTKLATSFFGITGQFYSVVLVGIIISKFSASSQHK